MAIQRQRTATDGPAVYTQDLTRKFGRFIALDNVNLEVPSGTLLGLLGPNGSGKTTLLSILAGFITPTSGAFQLLGETDHRRAMARTGSLISRPAFWPHLTCRENLRCLQGIYGQAPATGEVEMRLAQVGLEGGLAERKFGHCSLGMRQRLGIAGALMGNPHLVLLDEPTNGLDPEGMVEIRELVHNLGQQAGRTIIMSSHLLQEVELTCDSYAIIFRGKLVDQGVLGGQADLPASIHLETTDDENAIHALKSRGWKISRPSPSKNRPRGLEVEVVAGGEWKVARDLADEGIYPAAMRPAEIKDGSQTLEKKCLAAVGRAASLTGSENHD